MDEIIAMDEDSLIAAMDPIQDRYNYPRMPNYQPKFFLTQDQQFKTIVEDLNHYSLEISVNFEKIYTKFITLLLNKCFKSVEKKGFLNVYCVTLNDNQRCENIIRKIVVDVLQQQQIKLDQFQLQFTTQLKLAQTQYESVIQITPYTTELYHKHEPKNSYNDGSISVIVCIMKVLNKALGNEIFDALFVNLIDYFEQKYYKYQTQFTIYFNSELLQRFQLYHKQLEQISNKTQLFYVDSNSFTILEKCFQCAQLDYQNKFFNVVEGYYTQNYIDNTKRIALIEPFSNYIDQGVLGFLTQNKLKRAVHNIVYAKVVELAVFYGDTNRMSDAQLQKYRTEKNEQLKLKQQFEEQIKQKHEKKQIEIQQQKEAFKQMQEQQQKQLEYLQKEQEARDKMLQQKQRKIEDLKECLDPVIDCKKEFKFYKTKSQINRSMRMSKLKDGENTQQSDFDIEKELMKETKQSNSNQVQGQVQVQPNQEVQQHTNNEQQQQEVKQEEAPQQQHNLQNVQTEQQNDKEVLEQVNEQLAQIHQGDHQQHKEVHKEDKVDENLVLIDSQYSQLKQQQDAIKKMIQQNQVSDTDTIKSLLDLTQKQDQLINQLRITEKQKMEHQENAQIEKQFEEEMKEDEQ